MPFEENDKELGAMYNGLEEMDGEDLFIPLC